MCGCGWECAFSLTPQLQLEHSSSSCNHSGVSSNSKMTSYLQISDSSLTGHAAGAIRSTLVGCLVALRMQTTQFELYSVTHSTDTFEACVPCLGDLQRLCHPEGNPQSRAGSQATRVMGQFEPRKICHWSVQVGVSKGVSVHATICISRVH